jgi:multicomponent Na+:H+ antiporter subunit G
LAKIIGEILIAIGIIFVIFGYIGIFRFGNFYARILVSSKADTVGLITILTGVMLVTESTFFSLKVLLILLFAVLTTPITTHSIARSAYLSGYKAESEMEKKND